MENKKDKWDKYWDNFKTTIIKRWPEKKPELNKMINWLEGTYLGNLT